MLRHDRKPPRVGPQLQSTMRIFATQKYSWVGSQLPSNMVSSQRGAAGGEEGGGGEGGGEGGGGDGDGGGGDGGGGSRKEPTGHAVSSLGLGCLPTNHRGM